MTTTREVFDRHVSHQLDRDLDAILTDYAPDAIVVGPDGIGSGHDHIRAGYEQVLPLIGSLDLTSVQVQGEVVYVNFRAHGDGTDDLVGTRHLRDPRRPHPDSHFLRHHRKPGSR